MGHHGRQGIRVFDRGGYSNLPGLAILFVVMAFNFLGDGLRDVLDPRCGGASDS